jgi:hypothetical protein
MPSNTVTTPDGPRWVSISEAARLLGEHRQQISRMIHSSGTFPHRHLDRSGPQIRVLWTDDLARKVAGSKRVRLPG